MGAEVHAGEGEGRSDTLPSVIEVLFFSQKDVRQRLFERVRSNRGLLLVTSVHHNAFTKPVTERQPFAGLERDFGNVLDQLVIADEGTVDGMWRDPLGELTEALFPGDRARAYAAASGYLLLSGGELEAVVRKHADVEDDRWLLQEALASAHSRVPRPDPARKPGVRRRKPREAGAPKSGPANAGPPPFPPPKSSSLPADPWKLLGILPGTPLAEAKKAFRVLVAQYHPDKVAHLAPEFRELAERRTRQILEAWEKLEKELG